MHIEPFRIPCLESCSLSISLKLSLKQFGKIRNFWPVWYRDQIASSRYRFIRIHQWAITCSISWCCHFAYGDAAMWLKCIQHLKNAIFMQNFAMSVTPEKKKRKHCWYLCSSPWSPYMYLCKLLVVHEYPCLDPFSSMYIYVLLHLVLVYIFTSIWSICNLD